MRLLLMHICIIYEEKLLFLLLLHIVEFFFLRKKCMKNKVQSTIHADTSKN